jgi:fatty-acyl-CoA synthase/long-chain acyl-CoA synthetase
MLGYRPLGVCALVVLHKGVEMTEEELKEKLLAFMPKNEIPVKILFANEIPLNQIGKPDKKKAKEMFEKQV